MALNLSRLSGAGLHLERPEFLAAEGLGEKIKKIPNCASDDSQQHKRSQLQAGKL
jgi:hypothetical protein